MGEVLVLEEATVVRGPVAAVATGAGLPRVNPTAVSPARTSPLCPLSSPGSALQCPHTRAGFRPPAQCSNDSRCPGAEKCCFDTCLQHHTCKPTISIYGLTPVWSITPARLHYPSM